MTRYNVTGMSCAACSARVEKAVSAVDGVSCCSVNLLTNSMTVDGTASPKRVIKAVVDAGYGATIATDTTADNSDDTQTPAMVRRLLISLVFLLPLMYIAMGHSMWGWPVPTVLSDNPMAMAVAQLVLCLAVMIINKRFFISGFKGVIHRSPNMDTLVAMGSGASLIYSVYSMVNTAVHAASGGHMHDLYFESAAMILVLITVGKTLESYSKGKTTSALKALMSLAPPTALVVRDGRELVVPIAQVEVGDIFIVKSGDSVPVDGVIIDGNAAVDESALTGESIPVDKSVGDIVSSATINKSGYMRCRATRVGEDTTLSGIIRMVSDASATKAPIARMADKVSGVFVPVVMGIALVTFIVWLVLGYDAGYALSRGISVLVISCPCALGLATPVAIMVGNGVAARNGILFKNATAIEQTGKVSIVALDKTGTITLGSPVVTDVLPSDNFSRDDLLSIAYSVEKKSEHPLAKAIVDAAEDDGVNAADVDSFESLVGSGVRAVLDGKVILAGSYRMMCDALPLPISVTEQYDTLAKQGKTPLLFAYDGAYCGMIAVADVIKDDSPAAIHELQQMGISVVMLTGDNRRTADAISTRSGVDYVVSDVMPDGKAGVIRRLRDYGAVAMVGDGINDAPALTVADVGVAINAGTDIAIDAADVVLMNSRLTDVVTAIKLSRSALTNIRQNLFWAFIYNIIGIPLAAGVWIPIFGWTLSPMFGAAAMSLSSVCVVSNALRLNLFKPGKHMRGRRKNIDFDIKEAITMTKVVKVEGMMCPHCEAAVKKTLEALPQVESAAADHSTDTVSITLNADLDDSVIKNAIEDAGYKYIG